MCGIYDALTKQLSEMILAPGRPSDHPLYLLFLCVKLKANTSYSSLHAAQSVMEAEVDS